MDKKIPSVILYGLPLLFAAVLKCVIWRPEITPFNADEAIVALMARHINQGQIITFFYGQSYMGSLDAMIIAAGFRLFGEHVWVIRLVQSILYLGTVATIVLLATRLLKSSQAALFAGLLAAIPVVNVALYSTVSLGGYGEMLLIGSLLLLGGITTIEELKKEQLHIKRFYGGLVAWGLGAGFAFWVLGLTLIYSIPILIGVTWYLMKHKEPILFKGLACLVIGGLVGSIPWWTSAVLEGNLSVISELLGGAIAGASSGSWLTLPVKRAVNLVIFGGSVVTGIRPPWSVSWLMLPLMPFVLIFWLVVFLHSIRKLSNERLTTNLSILAMMGLVFAAGFVFSPYGDDPSGRYFLPFLVPMSLFAADLITTHLEGRRYWSIGIIVFLLFFNLGGIIQSVRNNPPGLTTQFDAVTQVDHSRMSELIAFLEDNDINTGYSNYWVSYPLAFLTEEEIIFIPRLPYHQDFRYTSRDDRYPPYTDIVNSSPDTAYITTLHPELDQYLRDQFSSKEITWLEKEIGDYTVYYQFSSPLHISEIGLGETTNP
jgi:4-amino-4-deoxy-L-arabinose transferase-like glycosyltransferase